MSNNYVKKYVQGNLYFDLPSSNLIYELPILSFGGIRNSFNLSLVYNKQNEINCSNLFNLTSGIKLNIQKRLIINNGNLFFCDSNGKTINLTQKNNTYTFNDDSKRILRFISGTYILENFDYSKELYNSDGYITEAYDKYGDKILKYNYSNNLLTSVEINNNSSKIITFTYNNSSQLSSITYSGNNNVSTNFVYNTNRLEISHFSGDLYNIYYTVNNFEATTYGEDNSIMYNYCQKCEVDSSNECVAVGNNVVNTNTFIFEYPVNQFTLTSSRIEIIDYYGVKNRFQYIGNRISYSYEVQGDDVIFYNDQFPGNVTVTYSNDNKYNLNSNYVQKPTDGIPMSAYDDYWDFDSNKPSSYSGYYIISGWFKQNALNFDNSYNFVKIGDSTSNLDGNYYIYGGNNKIWTFFSFKVYFNSTKIIFTHDSLDSVSFKDIKITEFIREKSSKDEFYAPFSEDILINKNDSSIIYSLNQLIFYPIDEDHGYYSVSFNDIFRYKINQKKNVNLDEFYYNDNNDVSVALDSNNMKFIINGELDTNINYLNDYYLGKRNYTNKGIIITKYIDDNSSFFYHLKVDLITLHY